MVLNLIKLRQKRNEHPVNYWTFVRSSAGSRRETNANRDTATHEARKAADICPACRQTRVAGPNIISIDSAKENNLLNGETETGGAVLHSLQFLLLSVRFFANISVHF